MSFHTRAKVAQRSKKKKNKTNVLSWRTYYLLSPFFFHWATHLHILSYTRAEGHFGDRSDIRRVCKQIMNKTVSRRIISKQEACVLLADLDLVTCTETIQSVPISNSTTIKATKTGTRTSNYKNFISCYKARPHEYELFSLHKYFHTTKNHDPSKKLTIPHFVGVCGAPRYPVTKDYARHTLIVHKPWREYPSNDTDWISEFNAFIHSPQCPLSARMAYQRVMKRYIDKTTHLEPKATTVDHSNNPISAEDEELMWTLGLRGEDDYDEDSRLFRQLNRGLNFQWDQPPKVRYSDQNEYVKNKINSYFLHSIPASKCVGN